jgi:hypothetical protein
VDEAVLLAPYDIIGTLLNNQVTLGFTGARDLIDGDEQCKLVGGPEQPVELGVGDNLDRGRSHRYGHGVFEQQEIEDAHRCLSSAPLSNLRANGRGVCNACVIVRVTHFWNNVVADGKRGRVSVETTVVVRNDNSTVMATRSPGVQRAELTLRCGGWKAAALLVPILSALA